MISLELLLRQSLFQGLPHDKLQQLGLQVRLQEFAKGEFVFHRGMPGDALVLLVAGRLQVISYSESGKEVGISFIEPGEYLGEIALIDGEPRSASVICVSQATVGFLAKTFALQLFHHEPLVAARIQKKLCAVIRNEIHHRSRFSTASAFERICSVLCSHPKLKTGNNPITLDDLPHQRVIASMANVTRETVNRAIKTLLQMGVIERTGRRVTVHKPQGLRLLASGQNPEDLARRPQTTLTEETQKGELVVRRYDKPKSLD